MILKTAISLTLPVLLKSNPAHWEILPVNLASLQFITAILALSFHSSSNKWTTILRRNLVITINNKNCDVINRSELILCLQESFVQNGKSIFINVYLLSSLSYWFSLCLSFFISPSNDDNNREIIFHCCELNWNESPFPLFYLVDWKYIDDYNSL